MKFFTTRFSVAFLAGWILLPITTAAIAQQDLDVSLSIPRVMVVDAVDQANGIVRLDGQQFKLVEDSGRVGDLQKHLGTPLALSQVTPGMEVVAVTDSAGAGGSRTGVLFGLWRPR